MIINLATNDLVYDRMKWFVQHNTTREHSNKKSMEVGDPRMAEMDEKEKKLNKEGWADRAISCGCLAPAVIL